MHAHVTPQRFQQAVLGGNDWHGMTAADGELDNLPNRWVPDRRIEEMDAIGRRRPGRLPDRRLLPVRPRPRRRPRRSPREVNEEVAEMVRDHPDRFMGLGTLPMQDIERAQGRDGPTRSRSSAGRVHDRRPRQRAHLRPRRVRRVLGRRSRSSARSSSSTSSTPRSSTTGSRTTSCSTRSATWSTARSLARALVYGGVMDRYPEPEDLPRARRRLRPLRARPASTSGWEVWPDSRGESQGQAEHLRRPLLLRHRHLHRPQPALHARRARLGAGRVRHRLAGADAGVRRRRPARRAPRCSRTRSATTCCGGPPPRIFETELRQEARGEAEGVRRAADHGCRAARRSRSSPTWTVYESERMIGKAGADPGRARLRLHLDARGHPDRRRGDRRGPGT